MIRKSDLQTELFLLTKKCGLKVHFVLKSGASRGFCRLGTLDHRGTVSCYCRALSSCLSSPEHWLCRQLPKLWDPLYWVNQRQSDTHSPFLLILLPQPQHTEERQKIGGFKGPTNLSVLSSTVVLLFHHINPTCYYQLNPYISSHPMVQNPSFNSLLLFQLRPALQDWHRDPVSVPSI